MSFFKKTPRGIIWVVGLGAILVFTHNSLLIFKEAF